MVFAEFWLFAPLMYVFIYLVMSGLLSGRLLGNICSPFDLSRVIRKPDFCHAKTKAQISFAVTAKLISAFVFATRIVHFFFVLNLKFSASVLVQLDLCQT